VSLSVQPGGDVVWSGGAGGLEVKLDRGCVDDVADAPRVQPDVRDHQP
jgi:hypothetical protein